MTGSFDVPWLGETVLSGWCAVWADGGPEVTVSARANGEAFTCDLGAAGWDLQTAQDVAVGYIDPAGHRVMSVFREEGYRVFLPLVTR